MNLPMPTLIDDFASSGEVIEALENLSNADLARLKSIAQLRSKGLGSFEWQDLIQETIRRTLEGHRKWPKSIAFIAFLAQTIRSVANEEWRRLIYEKVTLESDLNTIDSEESIINEIAINSVNPEREIIANNTLAHVEALFHGDDEALAVLVGCAKGDTPNEIQAKYNLTNIQYASAQKRIKRRITREFLNGGKL